MGRVDVEPDGQPSGPDEQIRVHRAERFAEHDIRAAVHEPDGLGVALDGHRGHGAFTREFDPGHPHLVSEGAESAAIDPLERVHGNGVGHGASFGGEGTVAPVGSVRTGG